jgi:hypothetical protein
MQRQRGSRGTAARKYSRTLSSRLKPETPAEALNQHLIQLFGARMNATAWDRLSPSAGRGDLDVLEQWALEDGGHSGASLIRPALEWLRGLVCQAPVDVLLV